MPRAALLQGHGGCQEPCPYELGDPEGFVPRDWGTPRAIPHSGGGGGAGGTPHGGPLTFPFPAGERAGGAGQVRGQRGRLGGRRAVPLRGQPCLLSPGRARPRPPPRPPPRHCSHPASTPATQGSSHAGRGRGSRPAGWPYTTASADEVGGPGYPASGGSHPGAPLVGGSGQAVLCACGGRGPATWGAGGEAWGVPLPCRSFAVPVAAALGAPVLCSPCAPRVPNSLTTNKR